MTCSMCENSKPLKKQKITRKYKESGLDNITLIGIDHYSCPNCGEEYFGYGNMEDLHAKIASLLLQKKGLLTGKEVRFLRKQLGYSGAMFAKLIGYDESSLSRLETEAQPIKKTFDHLVRFTVAAKIPDRDYDLHDQILKNEGIDLKRIQLAATSGGEWKLAS